MKRIIEFLKGLGERLLASIQRFWVSLLLPVVAVVLLIMYNHDLISASFEPYWERFTMLAALGFPLSLVLTYVGERFKFKPFLTQMANLILTGLLLIAYYHFWLQNTEYVSVIRYIGISLGLYLAFLFIPPLLRKDETDYSLHIVHLFLRFVSSFLYAQVIYLGTQIILSSFELLFVVQPIPGLGFDFWLSATWIFAPIYFLGGLSGSFDNHLSKSIEAKYPKGFEVLLSYILVPLVSVYTLMLYAFFGKILITRTWPSGVIAHLVLWYSVFSAVLLLFITPLDTKNRVARGFLKFFPKLNLPLLIMMFVAIGKRISAHGFTENRYFVLILGTWVAGWMLYYSIMKRRRNIFLPISLCLIIVLSMSGPWSSFTVSKNSQNLRLHTLLQENQLFENGKIVANPEVDEEVQAEIGSIVEYFHDKHSLSDLKILPRGFVIDDFQDLFGFKYRTFSLYGVRDRDYFSIMLHANDRLFSLDNHDFLAEIISWDSPELSINNGSLMVSFKSDDSILVINLDGEKVYERSVKDLSSTFLSEEDWPFDNKKVYEITDQGRNVTVRYIFKSINGWRTKGSGKIEPNSFNFYLLISNAD